MVNFDTKAMISSFENQIENSLRNRDEGVTLEKREDR